MAPNSLHFLNMLYSSVSLSMNTSLYAMNALKEFTPVGKDEGFSQARTRTGRSSPPVWEKRRYEYDDLVASRGRRTVIFGEDGHLLGDLIAPPGDGHVQPVVAADLRVRPATPLLVSLHQ